MNFKNIEYHFCGRSRDMDSIERALSKRGVTMATLKQVHSAKIITITDKGALSSLKRGTNVEADGYITNLTDIALTIHTADCVPLIATDGNWIGACHVGWKGLEKNIIENFMDDLESKGVVKDRLLIYLGPSISVKNFEVGNDVAARLSHVNEKPIPELELEKIVFPHKDGNKKYVDLRSLIYYRVVNARVKEKSVLISEECTYDKPDSYHSFRRDGKGCGWNLSFVMKL